jgi:hypothetical protein
MWLKMILDKQYHNCIVAVSNNGIKFLVLGPPELLFLCEGIELDDWVSADTPKNPGVFSCTIEVWKQEGNYENSDGDMDVRIVNLWNIIDEHGKFNYAYLHGNQETK